MSGFSRSRCLPIEEKKISGNLALLGLFRRLQLRGINFLKKRLSFGQPRGLPIGWINFLTLSGCDFAKK